MPGPATTRNGASAVLRQGEQVGDWRVVAAIGRGGMSDVYAVEHLAHGKSAALKVLLPEVAAQAHALERLTLEAWVGTELRHAGVAEVYQLGALDDGRPYLVMELLHGRTLGDAIERGRTPVATALAILEQICDVLSLAHTRGIVHRDLKPDNVILVDGDDGGGGGGGSGPVIKLVDWGIAKVSGEHLASGTLTSTGAIVGTPRYLAPEQARAQAIDARTDIYSLGVMAFELLLGVHPFEADSVAELLMLHMMEPPPPPRRFWPDMPVALERVLLAMLAKDPARRPALTYVAATLRALATDPTVARPGRAPRHCQRLSLRDLLGHGALDDATTHTDAPGDPTRPGRWPRLRPRG